MDWVVSGISLLAKWLEGNKNRWAWVLSFFNQGLWFLVIMDKKLWGLSVLCVASMIVAVRNFILWGENGERKEVKEE